MLHWDAAAMMPAGGAEARAEQLATLRLIAHQHLTAPEIGDLLAEAETEGDALDQWQRANLREMRRRRVHAAALPATLVEAESRACSECEAVWRDARAQNDFAAVLPLLERVLRLEREVAATKGEHLGTGPYEALLDQYEPGGSVTTIDRLFDELTRFLPDLLEAALRRQAALPLPPTPSGPFPVELQRRIGMRLMEHIGFDFTRGRLDVSAHPFCGGTPDDVRITTRYDESDFARALMGVLHETGHALYQRGLPANGACSRSAAPAAWRYMKASRCCSRCRSAAAAHFRLLRRRSCARLLLATDRAGTPRRFIGARSASNVV